MIGDGINSGVKSVKCQYFIGYVSLSGVKHDMYKRDTESGECHQSSYIAK